MGDEGKFDLPNSKIQSIANPWVGPGRGLGVILRYSRSIENDTPFSHIHDRVRSLNSLWDPPWMWEEGASFLCTPRVPKYFPWLITYLDCVYSHHFFFFSVWALIDSMNNFNVKFPWLLKMVLEIENLDYIKKKKCFFNYQTKDLFINKGVLLQILSIGHSREVPNCKISHTYFT